MYIKKYSSVTWCLNECARLSSVSNLLLSIVIIFSHLFCWTKHLEIHCQWKRHIKTKQTCFFYLIYHFLAHLIWKLKQVFFSAFVHCKHLKFLSSSTETLCQFQPNLVQGILGWRKLMFVHLKGHTLFQGR